MKIETGKQYKTREGRKAYIVFIRIEVNVTWPVIGYIEGCPDADTWTLEGRFHLERTDGNDLIEEV